MAVSGKVKPEEISWRKSTLFISALQKKSSEVVHLGAGVDREHLVHGPENFKRSPGEQHVSVFKNLKTANFTQVYKIAINL